MKKVFIGILLGLVLSAAGYFVVIPGIKQTSYDTGFKAGNEEGISAGTTAGIAKGITQIKDRQKHERDSMAEEAKNLEARRRAARKPTPVEKPVQNWHVIDGKIAEPVKD